MSSRLTSQIRLPSETYVGDFAVVFDDAFDVRAKPARSMDNELFLEASMRILAGVGNLTELALGDDDDLDACIEVEDELLRTVKSGYFCGKTLVERLHQ